MKIMADTNILFSALLLPESRPAQVLFQIIEHHSLILCDYIIISRDKHFLDLKMGHPKSISVADFLEEVD